MFKFILNLFIKFQKKSIYSTGAFESPIDTRNISIVDVQPPFVGLPETYKTDISMLPVENQMAIGSCVAQSHAKLIQLYLYRKTGKVYDLSARAIYKWAKEIDGLNSQGTYPSIMAKILRKKGIPLSIFAANNNLLSYKDYMDLVVGPGGQRDAASRVVGGYAFVPTDINLLKQAIYENGAVTATFDVDTNWFSGIITKVLNIIGRHSTLIYGYDQKGFFVRNSWGTGWTGTILNILVPVGDFYFLWEDYKDHIYDIIAYLDIPDYLLQEAEGKDFQFLNDLKIGSEGYEVYKLQERLNMLTVTGYFGTSTKQYVINYQIRNGLTADGSVGKRTREKLNMKPSKIDDWCEITKQHEGYFEGSVSFKNKNPGNLKFVGQKLAIGKDKKGFAIFKTYEDGYNTLKNMLIRCATGGSSVYHPTDTLYDFYSKYAPASDNNDSKRYAEVVANFLKVDPMTQIKNLI